MTKNPFRKLFFTTTLMCLYGAVVAIAQAPAPDLDSITEDSYQRMLAREKAEQESDTLVVNQAAPVLTKPATKLWEWWYVILALEGLVVILLVISHDRKSTNTKDRHKK